MFVPRYTEQELRDVVAQSDSLSQVLRHFGLRVAGGNFRQLRRWLERWGISIDHFRLEWEMPARERTPLSEILVENSTYSRGHLKRRLYEEGLKEPRCELCGKGEEWRGLRMALILDHVNGVANDHRLENPQDRLPQLRSDTRDALRTSESPARGRTAVFALRRRLPGQAPHPAILLAPLRHSCPEAGQSARAAASAAAAV
jgi:hypothetical protein